MGADVKTARFDGRSFGASITVRTTGDLKGAKKRIINTSWKKIRQAALNAKKKSVGATRDYITAIGRVETGYMRDTFDIHVPSKASGGALRINVGWSNWRKPIEYYDFQERGTYAKRVWGYGGKRFEWRTVKGFSSTKPKEKGPMRGTHGIEPMLAIGTVALPVFREVFIGELQRKGKTR